MTSATFSDFFTPLCPNSKYCLSANVGYFFTLHLPPLCGRHIWMPQREPVPSQLTVAFAQVTKVDTQNRKQEQICSESKKRKKFKISWEEGLQFNGNIICCRGHLPVWRLDVQMTLSLLRRGSWGITVRTGNGVWQNQLCGQFSS